MNDQTRNDDDNNLPISLVIGLGNPGLKYLGTRHNIGFEVIDEMARQLSLPFRKQTSLYEILPFDHAGKKAYLAKPKTYMNLSGEAVLELLDLHQLDPSQLLLVGDDFNLQLGAIRIRPSGSDGGHNGLMSVIELLETEEFPRMRLGLGAPPEGLETVDFVLGRFLDEEKEKVREMVAKAAKAAIFALDHRLEMTISKHNFNPAPPDQSL